MIERRKKLLGRPGEKAESDCRTGPVTRQKTEGAKKLPPVLQALKDAISHAAHLQQRYRVAQGHLEGGYRALLLEQKRLAETEKVVGAAKDAYLELVQQAAERGEEVVLQDDFIDKEVSVVQSTKSLVEQATRLVASYAHGRNVIGDQLLAAQEKVYAALDAVVQEVDGGSMASLLEWASNLLPEESHGPNGTNAGTLPQLLPPATSLPGDSEEDDTRLGVTG
jgi:hypothetical protein